MEVRFKLNLTVLSFEGFLEKSLTYKDVFCDLFESNDKMICEISDRLVLPLDEINLTFTLNR